jgi:hypothetical protein
MFESLGLVLAFRCNASLAMTGRPLLRALKLAGEKIIHH